MLLQEFFGIQLPIIQAPMAGVQGSALALAVCKAGGLGSVPAAMLSADALRQELATLQAQTYKPFNVNFFCHAEPQINAEQESAWQAALTPYYAELGLDTQNLPTGAGNAPFNSATADILEEFKPAVVSFHFGLPEASLITRIQSWGTKVIASATTVTEAKWLEAQGVDAIIAQGLEAGGHRGMFLTDDLTTQVGTFALVAQIVKAVSVPVIAAGGIADAQGVQAALALGAAGVQIGTAYLLCPEVNTTPIHRAALVSPAAQHTAVTNIFSGRPARGIMNRLIQELGPISNLAPEFPLARAAIAPLRAAGEQQGTGDFSSLWAGQNTSGCAEISATELTLKLSAGC